MTLRVVSLLTVVLLLAGAQASPRFRAVDVFVDTGESPLAAYQIEITSNSPEAKIVGVEGGATGSDQTGPYQQAPYYDAAALQGGRIILGAFTTDDRPPAGRFRVARLHFLEPAGSDAIEYTAREITAAIPGGERIPVQIELKGLGGDR